MKKSDIDNKCSNGWELDLHYYFMYKEKRLKKDIQKDETHYIGFTLCYGYKNIIKLYFNLYEIRGEFAVSNGMGKEVILDNTEYSRKNLNKLIELTKQLDDETLLKYNAETKPSQYVGFVASENF